MRILKARLIFTIRSDTSDERPFAINVFDFEPFDSVTIVFIVRSCWRGKSSMKNGNV